MSPIKNLSPDEKPREKLLDLGATALSDAELIAILIGSGNREQNAVELSRKILEQHHFSLDELAKSSVAELQRFKGIGEAKAITVAAALELGRRRASEDSVPNPKISSSKQAYMHIKHLFEDLLHEEFHVLLLNRVVPM